MDGLDRAAQDAGRPTGAQRIGVVDAVAARQRGSDQRQYLVPRVGPPRRDAQVEVMVDEFPQAQVMGEGGRKEQPGTSLTTWSRRASTYIAWRSLASITRSTRSRTTTLRAWGVGEGDGE